MRLVWIVLLVGCTSHHMPAGDDAMPPGDDDAMPPGPPTVDSVKTADGFTQIRQGETVQLVVTGTQLLHATLVELNHFKIATTSQTDTEIRGDVTIPHGYDVSPLAVFVTFPDQVIEIDNAIAITPYTVSASAAPGGHGTPPSPLGLCDPIVETATVGDVVKLDAGTHHCDRTIALGPGVTVAGDPAGTSITGTAAAPFGGFDAKDATLSDLALDAGIHATPGTQLSIDHVSITGAAGLEVTTDPAAFQAANVVISTYTYAGPGRALVLNGVNAMAG